MSEDRVFAKCAWRLLPLIAAVLCTNAAGLDPSPAQTRDVVIPDFSGIWGHLTFPDVEPPPSGPGPVTNLSRVTTNLGNLAPFNGNANAAAGPNGVSNVAQLIGDYRNPILKPAAAAAVKRYGEMSVRNVAPTPSNQCWPGGVPFVFWNLGVQMFQQKDEVTILYAFNNEVRHVRLNSQHPSRVTTSWFGDSVGHYEANMLVIDTVGVKVGPFAMVDMYGTPHTEALHVVERYRLLDYAAANEAEERGERGNFRLQVTDLGFARDPNDRSPGLLLEFTVDDPGVFTTPWSARVVYRHPLGNWPEDICADSPRDQVGREIKVPTAVNADF